MRKNKSQYKKQEEMTEKKNYDQYDQKQVHSMIGRVAGLSDVVFHESKFSDIGYETRKFKVTTNEQYPQSAWFQVHGNLINFPYPMGTKVEVFYNLKAYETQFNTQGTCLSAWQVRKIID